MSNNKFDLVPKQKKVLQLYLVAVALLTIATSLIVEINNQVTPIALALGAVDLAIIIGGFMMAARDAYVWRTKKSGYLPKGYRYFEGAQFTLKNSEYGVAFGGVIMAIFALIIGASLYFFELLLVYILTNKIWFGFHDPLFWIIGLPAACANGMLAVELFLAFITKEYEDRFECLLKCRTPENWVLDNKKPGFMDHQPSLEEARAIWDSCWPNTEDTHPEEVVESSSKN